MERDGRSERALRAVVDDYLEHVQEGDAVRPLEQDPIALLTATLDRLAIMRDTMVGLMQSTESELVIVAAAREWRHVEKELRDLMIAVGVLPRDLWRLRHVMEAREAADLLDRLLDGLEDGSLTARDVRARMTEWSGVPPVIEGTTLAAA